MSASRDKRKATDEDQSVDQNTIKHASLSENTLKAIQEVVTKAVAEALRSFVTERSTITKVVACKRTRPAEVTVKPCKSHHKRVRLCMMVCHNCGKEGHIKPACFEKLRRCRGCGNMGHMISFCRSTNRGRDCSRKVKPTLKKSRSRKTITDQDEYIQLPPIINDPMLVITAKVSALHLENDDKA